MLGGYGLVRALGAIVSERAQIGWTTWGHTGVDVMVYAAGPGSEQLKGSIENMQLGQRIASLMGWDLEVETSLLGAPIILAHERTPFTKPMAGW